jgi:hypothetical protein
VYKNAQPKRNANQIIKLDDLYISTFNLLEAKMSKALDITIKIVLIRNSFGKGIVCHAPAETREDFETT